MPQVQLKGEGAYFSSEFTEDTAHHGEEGAVGGTGLPGHTASPLRTDIELQVWVG